MNTDDYECDGCGSLPGEGRTKGCTDPEGCGYGLLAGGQGRSVQSVHDDGVVTRFLWAIGIFLGIVGAVVLAMKYGGH